MLRRRIQQVWELLQFLHLQRVKGFPPPDDSPGLDAPGLKRFEAELAAASLYLEFGSGGSTIVADRAGIPTLSVESDRFYAKAVEARLDSGRVRILTPRLGVTRDWGTPIISTRAKGLRYVRAPFPLMPFPDFILVDGRYRVACALECARQAQLAGARAILMIDDYVGRGSYRRVEESLGPPQLDGRAAIFIIGDRPVSEAAVAEAARDKR